MEKKGERQANAVSHCLRASSTPAAIGHPPPYPDSLRSGTGTRHQCHAVSQAQHIDWQTTEVEPGLELRLGALTVELFAHDPRLPGSRQQVLNLYNTSVGLPASRHAAPPAARSKDYRAGNNIVPNSPRKWTASRPMPTGLQHGRLRDGICGRYGGPAEPDRPPLRGGDLRITNRSIENLTVTGYGRAYAEHTNNQTTVLGHHGPQRALYPSLGYFYQQLTAAAIDAASRHLHRRSTAIGKRWASTTRWLPFDDDCNWVRRHFAVTGGYEYGTEHYQITPATPAIPTASRSGGLPRSHDLHPARHDQEHVVRRAWKRSGPTASKPTFATSGLGRNTRSSASRPAVELPRQRP